ncbi:MAG: hypothetical protein OXH75_22890 [Acidobacteria bacterium]|nr:hypothetical protein [Acidobacteriota bacterium]
MLGADLLARLLRVPAVSVRGYSSGARRIPIDVAARLHALALMVDDLGGACNDAGIRRWFSRPRIALGNRAPVDVLIPDWRPDDSDGQLVRSLAHAGGGALHVIGSSFRTPNSALPSCGTDRIGRHAAGGVLTTRLSLRVAGGRRPVSVGLAQPARCRRTVGHGVLVFFVVVLGVSAGVEWRPCRSANPSFGE